MADHAAGWCGAVDHHLLLPERRLRLSADAPLNPAFARLGLGELLVEAVSGLGYDKPTPIQAQAIPAVLAGRDILAAAQTGTGKTAAFALPLLHRLDATPARPSANHVRALILVPVRELAEQVHQALRQFGERMLLRTTVAYGGVSINPQMMALRRGTDILVATPGRLLDLHGKNAVRFGELEALVLDEADRMLDLGFADEIDRLLALLPRKRQTLLFSATFSDPIRELSRQLLQNPVTFDVSPRQVAATSVLQWAVPVDKRRKSELLVHLLRARQWPPVLVFAKTRKQVDRLVKELHQLEIAAEAIHGDRAQPARLRALQRFRDGAVNVLVATDVAARGLDIDALPLVVNFELPTVAEDYVHRIGRTGRAGRRGEAISLLCADEVEQLRAIEALVGQPLERRIEAEFDPDHRVPETARHSARGKPAKSRDSQSAGATPPPAAPARILGGEPADHPDSPAPAATAGRPAISFGKHPPAKSSKRPTRGSKSSRSDSAGAKSSKPRSSKPESSKPKPSKSKSSRPKPSR